jgi:MinD superfamily P-loop ATPase
MHTDTILPSGHFKILQGLLTMFVINQQVCTFCGGCAAVCPFSAIIIHDSESRIIEACTDCGTCAAFCPVAAIGPSDGASGRRIREVRQ